jgi:hypothetical protein
MDHIHTLNQIKEKCKTINHFVYPSLTMKKHLIRWRQSVLKALQELGIHHKYITLLTHIDTNCTAIVTMHNASDQHLST